MSLDTLPDTSPDADLLLALNAASKQLKPLLKSVLSYEQLGNLHKSAFLHLEIEDVCHFQIEINKMEMDRFDSKIRGARFAYDQGLQAYEKLLSQTCYNTFKCGDLVAVEEMSQLMTERLQQQHAVIKSLLDFIAAQQSDSVATLTKFTLEVEFNIKESMESAIKRIETTRSEARIAHTLRSRLVGRDLSMLDLPNETLLNIIQLVSKNFAPICQT